jgi:FMN phosphatase YigB (HAD superfamily)
VLFDSGDVLMRPTSPDDAPVTQASILFVDDWPPHVQTALAAGFQGAVLDRRGGAPAVPSLTYLTSLYDLQRLVVAATARSARS